MTCGGVWKKLLLLRAESWHYPAEPSAIHRQSLVLAESGEREVVMLETAIPPTHCASGIRSGTVRSSLPRLVWPMSMGDCMSMCCAVRWLLRWPANSCSLCQRFTRSLDDERLLFCRVNNTWVGYNGNPTKSISRRHASGIASA